MRMIGIGLMAFFIAWAVFTLSSHNIAQRGLRQLNEMAFGPQLVFETESKITSRTGNRERVFFRSTKDAPIILTGLPSYQSAAFLLPIDAHVTSGYLQIDMTAQVLANVTGILRVSINNTKRGEILLYQGEVGRSLLIPLKSIELAKERLVVSYSLLGSYDTNSCNAKNGIQAIVEIEATSGLFLNLNDALSTPRDRVLSHGRKIHIAWDESFTEQEKSKFLAQSAIFMRNGENVAFEQDAASTNLTLDELIGLNEKLPKLKRELRSFPYFVARNGANFGLKRFYKTTSWRIRYQPTQFIGHQLPSAIDLNLVLSGARENANWMLSVTLNGSLIYSESIDTNLRKFRKTIALSKKQQSATNLIEITLDSADTHQDICNEGPILLAQMEQATALLGGDVVADFQLSKLQEELRKIEKIGVSMGKNTTHHQAKFMSQIMALSIPETVAINSKYQDIQIKFLERSEFQTLRELYDNKYQQWVLSLTDSDELIVSNLAVDDLKNLFSEQLSPNVALISLPKTGGEG